MSADFGAFPVKHIFILLDNATLEFNDQKYRIIAIGFIDLPNSIIFLFFAFWIIDLY